VRTLCARLAPVISSFFIFTCSFVSCFVFAFECQRCGGGAAVSEGRGKPETSRGLRMPAPSLRHTLCLPQFPTARREGVLVLITFPLVGHGLLEAGREGKRGSGHGEGKRRILLSFHSTDDAVRRSFSIQQQVLGDTLEAAERHREAARGTVCKIRKKKKINDSSYAQFSRILVTHRQWYRSFYAPSRGGTILFF